MILCERRKCGYAPATWWCEDSTEPGCFYYYCGPCCNDGDDEYMHPLHPAMSARISLLESENTTLERRLRTIGAEVAAVVAGDNDSFLND